ncbi:MAG: FAD-dependent oxidoreductase, partial [Gemmatirosa sp.]|nr:FAD-dependent oxidoreductase [Gemmatirosa sp.]
RYELLLRLVDARPWSGLGAGFKIDRLVNGKTDWNNQGPFSTDFIGRSWDYPDADYARRAAIWQAHEDYQKGLLYFVASDPRVPSAIRDEMRGWGYCRDEFLDTDGWPHQLYVREARRMVGAYVMTQHNVVGDSVVADGVAMAAYGMDSHNTQRLVVNGMARNEGDVQVGGFAPYPIAYRALTPRPAEATNLLVPVALSATHIAFGSIRMEPVFMALGQAAAVAAGLAIDSTVAVQRVNVAALQRELRENPLADGSVPELLVDDASRAQVDVTGDWSTVRGAGAFGPSALRSGPAGGSVRFRPRVRTAGRYAVYLYWPRAAGLGDRVPVAIHHADGTTVDSVDMRAPTATAQGGIAQWHRLGEFRFDAGGASWVELRVTDAQQGAVADALLLVPSGPRAAVTPP